MFGLQMVSPSFESVKKDTAHTARIVPIYSLTNGITQKQIRFLVRQTIDMADELEDWLDDYILEKADLVPLANAIRGIHFPENSEDLKICQRRLKFDEIFLLQLRSEMIRQSIKKNKSKKIIFKEEETKNFVNSLPFELTKKQKISAWEILQDMDNERPMNRLLEGDVGSGKTVVATMALYNTVLNNSQAVLMAPTEILAFQHYETLCKIFEQKKINIALLTGTRACSNTEFISDKKNKKSEKKELIEKIKKGEIKILVGTHALLTEKVKFKDLELVIVDEQHRFGVDQRKTIREKSGNEITMPHFLSMTATPIHRSFALTLYGELDISIIDEMPADRKLVKTRLVDPHNRDKAYEFIKKQVEQGRQVFVICPLIEDNKDTRIQDTNNIQIINYKNQEKKSVLSEYEKLSKQIFPDLRVGYLHGKLKTEEKGETMKKFVGGDLDILVSTSVVEVGVDIPNASVMMIEGADRFGLAQLHQFRGRVGRSEHQSYCFIFSDSDSKKSQERLEFFEKNNSGFAVAQYDLETRGPGEVYGTTQSGMMNFRLASWRDSDIIKIAREIAIDFDFGRYPQVKEKIKKWEDSVHLE